MGPGDLAEILEGLPIKSSPDLLVGIETSDDAGIYRISDDLALIQTLDFFTPIVNDPYDFGRIAAANSLSDVYAMGGTPLTAMNIVCFPIKDMDKNVLKKILQGGLDVINKAGAYMLGGHSVEDPEIKYGLSVTGLVHPQKFLTNSGARPGDLLVLTKPLGTGILATALKAKMLSAESLSMITELMAELNKDASEAMMELGVSACTDITGFGLIGHALEMAQGSKVAIKLYAEKVPIIPDAISFANMGLIPEGSHANQKFCSNLLRIEKDVDPVLVDLMVDAQTSGGLLISVSKEKADDLILSLRKRKTSASEIIGEVLSGEEIYIQVV